ncbi:hypothetical protein B1813_00940 [Saccharomonospora piscinae]|uniref:Methyltransferase, cyclopropane fatty acid synthase n=1 Tax=Saccharomonospora piscinae TaxID=687388 RepID=A0A1V9ADB7_SACPI|nr:cyclopropane-fatty-acyl-phospholipid synthase family protein [Saccharomonospora piscinae]OQO95122.1 hypothetical protein B1813_00940 [Saccharomonospora piscinae]
MPTDPPTDPTWAELAVTPHAPLRAWAAERLFRHAVADLPVTVWLPGGRCLGAGGPVLQLVRPRAFFHRLGADAKIGFGEAYLAGDWTADDLPGVLTPFARRMAVLVPRPLQLLRRWVDLPRPEGERNTVRGARRNIHRHYDLSNELFAEFLDETMTYSCASFAGDGDDLATAQRRKIDEMLDLARVGPGTDLLEIGTGWGELALRAARRGARVTTLTLSEQQRALAAKRMAEEGVADRVEVVLCDYREARGHYDAIVSVEMIEAVGAEYWPDYFATLDRLLEPGGRVALQAITMPHDRLLATRDSHTWIHKYVFPGGQLLSVPAVEQALRDHTTLRVRQRHALGADYARTLSRWRSRFLAAWPAVAALGFDTTFRRMWEFYLAYCEAGFRAGYLDVHQFALDRAK